MSNVEFYSTFKEQIEILPRLTVIYGGRRSGGDSDNFKYVVAAEWLWFGVFVEFGKL